ncbi:hypothetical protein [Flavobacterium alkalisoli]|uniref:hypothetical protein n=1 Tax=Flavobacterium alkalisoli TaxID=2602769 RepID=UPI003A8CF86D
MKLSLKYVNVFIYPRVCSIFGIVKKALIYILISLMSLNCLSIREFLKVPVLCQHFMEHKKADKEIGLLDFLAMHYWGNDLNDNDDSRDMQLPFKNIVNHAVPVLFLPQNNIEELTVFVQPVAKNTQTHKKDLYSCIYYSSLIKPPAV